MISQENSTGRPLADAKDVYKRQVKHQTSKGMRRAAKKSCQEHFEDSITLTRKSHNLHGIDAFKLVEKGEAKNGMEHL